MSVETVPLVNEEHADQTDPFRGFKITNWKVLDELNERSACPQCNKSRKYFCYTCCVPVPQLKNIVPKVELPVKIDIIKHAKEIDGKSTAVHAAIIAPDSVTIYTYPCIPNYTKEEKVVLIFPGKNALTIPEYFDKYNTRSCESDNSEPACKKERRSEFPITRAIFIDSTWNQSRGIYKDERLRSLPCVVLQSRISEFWRHQHGSPRWFLATIEAVHQFLVELTIYSEGNFCGSRIPQKLNSAPVFNTDKPSLTASRKPPLKKEDNTGNPTEDISEGNPEKAPSKFVRNLALCRDGVADDSDVCLLGPNEWEGRYDGRYDNLLFFFRFMYSKIHKMYDPKKLRSYKRPIT